MPGTRAIRTYGGVIATSIVALVWLVSRLGEILRRFRHPLTSSQGNGTDCDDAVRIREALGLTKVAVHNGKVRFVLDYPAWPSRAYARMVARGGLRINPVGTRPVRHVHTAFLAITSACPLRCQHCYARVNHPGDGDLPVSRWRDVLRDLQEIGVGVVVLTGGEPMCRFEAVLDLLSSANRRYSEFHLHTSGHGVTPERARHLGRAGLAAAGIGFDHWDREHFDRIRGYPGAMAQATQAVRCFQDAGVFTYLNTCLTKELVRSQGLPQLLDTAKGLGVGIVRLLEPKPCGGYSLEDPVGLFSDDDRRNAEEFLLQANRAWRRRHHPLVLMPSHMEAPERLGCRLGGQSILEVDSRGNVLPCIFVPVSFGNVRDEDLRVIFARMREATPAPVHAQCPAITLAPAIRAKAREGIQVPVPYEVIRREFDLTVTRAA